MLINRERKLLYGFKKENTRLIIYMSWPIGIINGLINIILHLLDGFTVIFPSNRHMYHQCNLIFTFDSHVDHNGSLIHSFDMSSDIINSLKHTHSNR